MRRHFLIRLSEVERICAAVRQLAAGVLAEATADELRAKREAVDRGTGNDAFRFQAPAGAEHLVTVAIMRVRRDAGEHFTVGPPR